MAGSHTALAGIGFSDPAEEIRMRRRDFIVGLGAAAWPVVARAQQGDRMRRIGVMEPGSAENDPVAQMRLSAFRQALQELGWTEGRNVRFDYRWPSGDRELIRKDAAELVALAPDVILADGAGAVGPLQQATRTVPIVFTGTVDPVAGGFVESLARPGGHTTGFILFEYSLAGKWAELLKQIVPLVKRAAVVRDPSQFAGGGQLGAVQAVAPFFALEVSPIDVRTPDEIERAIAAFAGQSNGGLIVLASNMANINRHVIIAMAARHRLPAVYSGRHYVDDGGLMSYGPDRIEPFRRAAGYVDRILKGEKPSDLPVQAPTKYELVINAKTAKTLGLEVPAALLARADEVIE
jgi:putative ABC transport system substrate-binding protein